ncbi:unnamed protein product, partial [Mesorhabditis spiculigera]
MNSSIESLRSVEPWTLEQDSQLCSIFENLLRHVQTRSQDLQGRLVNINQNISSLDATVECINGRLDLLASRQFVEHRIVEENLTRPSPSPEMSRHTPATPSHDDTRNSLRDAIRHGVNFLAASGLGNEELRQPNLIGSAEFYTSVLPEMAEKVVDNPIPQIPQPIDCGIPPPPVPPQQIPLQIPEPEFSDQEPIASAGILATTATVIQPAPLAVIPVVPVIPAKPVLPKPTVTPARKGGLFDSDDSDEEDIFAQAKKRVATKSESPFDSSLSKKSTVSSIRFLEEEAEPEEFHQDKPSQPEKPKNAFAPSLADVLSATSSLRNKSIDDQSPTRRPVTQPPPKQQTEQPKKEPEQSAASGGRLLPVKAYIGTSERPEKKSTPAQITHKKSLFDDSDSDSELYKKPTKPEPKKGDHPKQEPQNTAPETTQQSIVQPTVSPVKVEEKKEQTVEELKDSIRTLLKENEEADRELIRDIISPEIARKGEKEETSDSPKSPQKSTVSTDTVENQGKPEVKPDPVSEASAAETEGKAVEPEVESSPEYTSEHPQKSEPGTTVIPEVQDTFKVSPPPFEPQESNPEPIEQNPAVPEKSEESTVAPPRIEEKLEEPSTRPVFEPEPEAPPIFEPSEAPPLFTVPLDTVESTVSPPPFEEELEKPPAPPVFEPEPEAPPPFPKSRSPPATVAKPVEADLEVPPPFLGNREEEALEAPPPFRFEPEEREELPFGPPSFAPAAEEPDFPLPIPSDHLLYSPPPFDIDRLSRKEEEKQVEFPAEKDEKEDQPLPTTTLDDTEEMSGARGKLNNSAFASKLSAALAMPPGGPRPPGAPSSSTSSPASSSSAAPLRRAASEQPPRSPESRLFDEKPSLLSSMAKGRPKGPPRRPPTTRNRLSQDINSSRPISVTSSRASSTDQKEESAPIFRRNPSLIQTRATKSMVLPSSPIKSDEVVIERKLSNTRISEGGSASGRKSSTSSSRSSLHGGDEDKKGVTAVQNSPPIVRKGSTGSRISITSQTVKSQDTKEPTQPKKKSLFDSESSDDDLFRGKAASTAKTAPKKASVITTTVTKDNTKPPAGPSSTSTTSRPPAPKTTSTAPKKSLFDDSDDDLDLFRKKK